MSPGWIGTEMASSCDIMGDTKNIETSLIFETL